METIFAIFPWYGRNVSTLWKKRMDLPMGRPIFSMLWKLFSAIFHGMEEMFPCCGKLGFWAVIECAKGARGCSPKAVERSAQRPLSTVERDRSKWPGKWCPMKSGSALSRSRLGCGVVARPFFWPRGRGFHALSGATRALRAQRGFT